MTDDERLPAIRARATAEGPLTLLEVRPPAGSGIEPQERFALRFDRALSPLAATPNMVNCMYPDPQAEFVTDPFRLSSAWLSPEGDVLYVKPPELLTGREVVLFVREGLRAADGTVLQRDPAAPPGVARAWRYRVLELPLP